MPGAAIPRVRTEALKIRYPISRCGDNWWKDVRVRAPHDDADAAHRTLPSLGSVDQVEAIDPEFPQEMVEDFKRIRAFAKRHASDMSAKQKANIQEMLDRAKLYINDAQTVWEFWAKGFTTPTIGQVPPWPLNGKPQGPVGQEIEEGHLKDREKWQALVLAALRNMRCAEEVAKKATIRAFNRRKQHHDSSGAPAVPLELLETDTLELGEIELG